MVDNPGDDDSGEISAVKSKNQTMMPWDQEIATHEAMVPRLCWGHWAVRRSQTTA